MTRQSALILFNRGIEPVTVLLPREKVGDNPLQDWLELGIDFKQEEGQTHVTLPARGLALLGSARPIDKS